MSLGDKLAEWAVAYPVTAVIIAMAAEVCAVFWIARVYLQ